MKKYEYFATSSEISLEKNVSLITSVTLFVQLTGKKGTQFHEIRKIRCIRDKGNLCC